MGDALGRFLATWGIAIISGFLIALVALWWIDPQTPGGSLLLIVTVIAISVATSAASALIISALAHFRRTPFDANVAPASEIVEPNEGTRLAHSWNSSSTDNTSSSVDLPGEAAPAPQPTEDK